MELLGVLVVVDGGVGDLQRLMVADRTGATVNLTVLRHGRQLDLELVPVELH